VYISEINVDGNKQYLFLVLDSHLYTVGKVSAYL